MIKLLGVTHWLQQVIVRTSAFPEEDKLLSDCSSSGDYWWKCKKNLKHLSWSADEKALAQHPLCWWRFLHSSWRNNLLHKMLQVNTNKASLDWNFRADPRTAGQWRSARQSDSTKPPPTVLLHASEKDQITKCRETGISAFCLLCFLLWFPVVRILKFSRRLLECSAEHSGPVGWRSGLRLQRSHISDT